MALATLLRSSCLIMAVATPPLASLLLAQGAPANPSKEYIYVNGKLTAIEFRATGQALPVVTADSVSPSSGSTTNATLMAVYSDTAGYASLGSVYLLVNAGLDGSHA